MNHNAVRMICAVCLVFLFSACTKMNTEEALRQRVQTEWDARVNRKLGTVYDMTVNSYRQEVERDAFLQRPHLNIEKFVIKEVKMTVPGEEAVVKLDFTTKQMGFDFTFPKEEKWLFEDGEWRLNVEHADIKMPFGDQTAASKEKEN